MYLKYITMTLNKNQKNKYTISTRYTMSEVQLPTEVWKEVISLISDLPDFVHAVFYY